MLLGGSRGNGVAPLAQTKRSADMDRYVPDIPWMGRVLRDLVRRFLIARSIMQSCGLGTGGSAHQCEADVSIYP